MSDPATRAEAARRKILASGDPELIGRLHLLDAAAPGAQSGAARRPAAGASPGLLGMGLAVAGGAWLGTVLAGLTLSGEMQAAFADVAEDLGIDMAGIDPATLGEGGDIAPTEASDIGDGDLFDGFGDFFDL